MVMLQFEDYTIKIGFKITLILSGAVCACMVCFLRMDFFYLNDASSPINLGFIFQLNLLNRLDMWNRLHIAIASIDTY